MRIRISSEVLNREEIDGEMNGVVDDDHQHGAHVGRRAQIVFGFAPRPLLDAHHHARKAIAVDDHMRPENDRERPRPPGDKRERRSIDQRVDESDPEVRGFLPRHPIGLQHIIADKVTDQLVHGFKVVPLGLSSLHE